VIAKESNDETPEGKTDEGEVSRKRRAISSPNDMRVMRKEYRQMSDAERSKFHKALNRLKFDQIDGMSKYDLLVIYHTPPESPGAHWGPAFLPFHREWIKQLVVIQLYYYNY
jgi:hypothetical protein